MLYSFSVIRFVPNVISGEQINLGLIIGSDDSGEWTLELVSRKDRARRLDDNQSRILPGAISELESLAGLLDDFTRQNEYLDSSCVDLLAISTEWLRGLAENSIRSCLQYSDPFPVKANSLQDAIDKIWSDYIIESESNSRGVTKRSVLSKVKQSMLHARLNIGEHIYQSRVLSTTGSHSPIDLAIHNGHVVQLTQCWSFQVQDTDRILNDVKSWAWTIRDLRRNGGVIKENGVSSEEQIEPKTPITVVYALPEDGNTEVVQEAIAAFEDDDVNATHISIDKVDEIAHKTARLLSIDPDGSPLSDSQ